MRRAQTWVKVLAAIGACGLVILGSLAMFPRIGEVGSRADPARGPTEASLRPSVGEGGNIATACDDVDTCTTGSVTNVTAGDTLVVVVTEFTTSAGAPSLVEEITPGGDNDLTVLGSTPCIAGSGHGVTAIYGLADVAAEASVTFTVNYAAAEYYTIHALDVKGTTATPFETAGTGVCSSAAGATGTAAVTTTTVDDLVVLGVEVRASTAITATGGDTLVNDASTTGADLDSGGLLVELDAATGSISLSATFTSASWSAIAVALKTSPLVSGTVSPAAPTLDAGQSVTLSTTAASGGTPPIEYQWYTATSTSSCSSGTAVGSATGLSYTTPALSMGTYDYCVWATDNSTPTEQVVQSNVANVTVNPAPSVAIAPRAPSLDPGQTIPLNSSTSGGTGKFTYAWYAGSTCTGPVLATTRNYTPPPLAATTTYCLAATDSSYVPETVTTTVTVNVSASPLAVAITPASPSVNSGQALQLTANPTGGTGADSYAWYAGSTCTGPVLATTRQYTTPSLTTASTYCVSVKDSSSVPETANASTTVAIRPPSGPGAAPLPPYVYPVIGVLVALAVGLLWLALFARRRRTVTFTELGLPEETAWSLTLDGVPMRSTGPTISARPPKGKHDYAVQTMEGFTAAPASGTIEAGKAPVDVRIIFTRQGPDVPSGPPTPTAQPPENPS